ncbi:MAG TPA: Gfo/Idh/MocA family oxidoreductase [Tepidisphaeraceae bacterium]|jgi:predicted dehydrogenase|nr:Gfo/Idh/MocA family oxidoreductase [Tepidisphaeraceae bacterium]
MTRVTRRSFLATSAAIGATTLFSTKLRAIGANDDVRMAVVGLNGRGQEHMKVFPSIPGVRLVALCDADERVLNNAVKNADGKGSKVQGYKDIRKLLESKDVDAIAIATPNHWHSLMTVWGCQAGKDVYVEKPCSHEIWEGRKDVEAAEKYKRVVQIGTQRRSDTGFAEAVAWLQAGNLGKILYARGLCYKPRPSIGKVTQPTPIPASVDYDLWCGPAPMEPLMRKNLHYDWHWVWPTGNGDIGNQGVHEMDQCRWALGQNTLPERVFAFGGRFGYDDDATTPNTEVAIYDYKPAPLIFEVRGLPRKKGDTAMDAYRSQVRIGLVVQCENGYYSAGENGGWAYDNDDKKVKQFTQAGQKNHQANFIKAVRSRKPEDNVAPILGGHLSSALCHMGNISYRVGKQVPPTQLEDMIKSDKLATESFERVKQHLAANGVDLGQTPPTLGPSLAFDPQKEQFTGAHAEEANKLVRREYRAPYVIPDQV